MGRRRVTAALAVVTVFSAVLAGCASGGRSAGSAASPGGPSPAASASTEVTVPPISGAPGTATANRPDGATPSRQSGQASETSAVTGNTTGAGTGVPGTTAATTSSAGYPPGMTQSPSGVAESSTSPAATTPATSGGQTAPSTAPPGDQGHGITVTAADRSQAVAVVAGMSTTDKAASVIMADSGQIVDSDLLARHHFGGVILMATRGVVDGTSGGTPDEVAALTATLRRQASQDPTGAPILIGTDQEYGDVVRLRYGFTQFPGASQLAAIPDTDRAVTLTREIAHAAAQELLAVGVSVDFAPVSDVLPTDGSGSAIGARSYGSDPQRVARLVTAAVTGYQAGGVAAVLKHFPGLGRVATDTHLALPTLGVDCASWNAHEAVPVRAGIKAGALAVLTGHVLLPAADDSSVPASISPAIVTDLLRGAGSGGCTGMHFSGVTVTDSLQMEPIANVYTSGQAAVRALKAGQDLLLMPFDADAAVQGIVAAVSSGELAASRLDAAATADLALRLATARVQRPPMSVIDSPAHRKLAAEAQAAAGVEPGS
jgi:beta-N-acetylhexosaminidase